MQRRPEPLFCRPFRALLAAAGVTLGLAACVTRSVDVMPEPANGAEFAGWDCERIADERDRVLQRALDRAHVVDEHAGNNIIVLGVGATLFWPALVALRGDSPDAQALAQLKGREEALRTAAQARACAPPGPDMPVARAAALPLALGERLVFEDRRGAGGRGPAGEWALRLTALRRGDLEYRSEGPGADPGGIWQQDLAGNVTASPEGALLWPHLLRSELVLGGFTAGDILVTGDPTVRARVRGQVVAVGPQTVAGRRFEAAVIELSGDAQRDEVPTRLDGVIVIDRSSGLLLRLDLRCALPEFSLQRRLQRVEPPA